MKRFSILLLLTGLAAHGKDLPCALPEKSGKADSPQGIRIESGFEPEVITDIGKTLYTVVVHDSNASVEGRFPTVRGLTFEGKPSFARITRIINGVTSKSLKLSHAPQVNGDVLPGRIKVPAWTLRMDGESVVVPPATLQIMPLEDRIPKGTVPTHEVIPFDKTGNLFPEGGSQLLQKSVLLFRRGNLREARNLLVRSCRAFQIKDAKDEKIYAVHQLLLMKIHFGLGEIDKAIEYSYELGLHANDADDKSAAFNGLGAAYLQKGEYRKSIQYCRKSLSVLKERHGYLHPMAESNFNIIGQARCKMAASVEDVLESIELLETALAISLKVIGETNPRVAHNYHDIAMAYLKISSGSLPKKGSVLAYGFGGRYGLGKPGYDENDHAIQLLKKSSVVLSKIGVEDNPLHANVYNALGMAFENKGDLKMAMSHYGRALETDQGRQEGSDGKGIAATYGNMGVVHQKQGDFEAAVEMQQKALRIRLKVLDPLHPEVGMNYLNLGGAYEKSGKRNLARKCYDKALPIFIDKLGNDHPRTRQAREGIRHLTPLSEIEALLKRLQKP